MSAEHVTDEELVEVATILANRRENNSITIRELDRIVAIAPRACRELRALRAPVDVAGDVERALLLLPDHLRSENVRVILRPHVTARAVLAREAAGLRGQVEEWKAQASANAHGCEQRRQFQEAAEQERDTARAEIERLEKAKAATERLADAWKALAKAREKAWGIALDGGIGTPECNAVRDDVVAAEDALLTLGIDPDAP